jgi:Flp pilus assembly protein TadG
VTGRRAAPPIAMKSSTRRSAAGVGRALRDERGAVATELVLLTPLLILMLLFVVALGRLAGARIDVDGAAAQAARAASIATTPGGATAAAQQSAAAALGSDHVTCATLQVATDTARFAPGGSVTVTVTCAVALSDLSGLRLPVTEQVSSTAASVVDTYRSAPGP